MDQLAETAKERSAQIRYRTKGETGILRKSDFSDLPGVGNIEHGKYNREAEPGLFSERMFSGHDRTRRGWIFVVVDGRFQLAQGKKLHACQGIGDIL